MGRAADVIDYNDGARIARHCMAIGQYREALLFTLGINTALRFSDWSPLTWSQVTMNGRGVPKRIALVEEKTGRTREIFFGDHLRDMIWEVYHKPRSVDEDLIFWARRPVRVYKSPLSLRGAINIMKAAACSAGYSNWNRLSTHSMRKSFAHRAYDTLVKGGTQEHFAFLQVQRLLGHAEPGSTSAYLSGKSRQDVFEALETGNLAVKDKPYFLWDEEEAIRLARARISGINKGGRPRKVPLNQDLLNVNISFD